MIKQVQSFKSSDGELHETRLEALDSEYSIQIQGLIQRILPPQGGAAIRLSPTEIARIMKTNSRQFMDIMRKYDTSIRRATAMPKINVASKK